MRRIEFEISDVLYSELEAVASSAREMTYGPETLAREIVEAELASRRMPRVRLTLSAEDVLARRMPDYVEDL